MLSRVAMTIFIGADGVYGGTAPSRARGGAARKFDQAPVEATGEPVASKLWSGFGSPELDALITRAIAANTTIAQALARLNETRALSGLAIYSWLPTITAGAGQEEAQFSGQDPFSPPGGLRTETWRAGFDATWEIDLFGGLRNENRAIRRRAERDEASLADVRLSIIAETAQTWFALIGARERLALRRQQLTNLQDNVGILKARVDAGNSSALDLAQAEAQMRSVAASVPESEAELVRQEQRLSVLTAWPVATLRAALRPRPDSGIAGARCDRDARRMAQAPSRHTLGRARAGRVTHDVGDEIAEYFPKVELLGSFGWTSATRDQLGDDEAERWSYGPSISWSFLNFGRVTQNVKAAQARRDGAIALYQETVLQALEETENALAGFRAANQSEDELRQAPRPR